MSLRAHSSARSSVSFDVLEPRTFMSAAPGASQAALNSAAVSAYEYLYPLVNQYFSERIQTDVSAPNDSTSQAPVNQLYNNSLAPLQNNTGPNADTLYTGGWLDLSKGPIILHVPNYHSRYYTVEFSDAWTNTFSIIGTPTTGTASANYALVDPGWHGVLPAGVKKIQAPTNLVGLLARTLVYGQGDLNTADAYRRQITLTPLKDFGRNYTPPSHVPAATGINTVAPVAQQVANLTGTQFFSLASRLLITNPPLAGDRATGVLKTLSRVGVTPGSFFDLSHLTSQQLAAVKQAPASGTAKVTADAAAFERSGKFLGQWYNLPSDLSEYGTHFADRAGAAATGVFVLANPAAEALYLSAFTDSTGKPLNGSNDYEITFAADHFPPASYFWSVTLYQSSAELYPNAFNRYEIGNRSPFKLNPNGSLTIYVGNSVPAPDLESNWIPAPKAPFTLTLRLYGPEENIIHAGYAPPPVVLASYPAK